MLRLLVLAAAAAAAAVPAASALPKTGFAFGREGGSIRPFRVVIATDGTVRVSGPVTVGRRKVARLQLGELNRLAATSGFDTLPPRTSCPQTLPDVAETYIRVGPLTVHVHGPCVAAYQRLWKALGRAVRLSP